MKKEIITDYSEYKELNRYQLVDCSISAHCCFGYTVIDTHGNIDNSMCECFEEEDGIKIVNALNFIDKLKII